MYMVSQILRLNNTAPVFYVTMYYLLLKFQTSFPLFQTQTYDNINELEFTKIITEKHIIIQMHV